jgi:hypothetical protein
MRYLSPKRKPVKPKIIELNEFRNIFVIYRNQNGRFGGTQSVQLKLQNTKKSCCKRFLGAMKLQKEPCEKTGR